MGAKSKQLENDAVLKAVGYQIKYHPYGAARELFHMHDPEILMAGPAGTGKSLAKVVKGNASILRYLKI